MAQRVAGDNYFSLSGQLLEIQNQLRLKNGYPHDEELLKRHLQAAIEGRFGRVWPFWKTIEIGGLLCSGLDFSEAFERAEVVQEDPLWNVLEILHVPAKPLKVDLIRVAVWELGFRKTATYEEIRTRAKEYGLTLCRIDIGPQLRLQYPDQRFEEVLHIASPEICGSDGEFHSYVLTHDKWGLRIGLDSGHPGGNWGVETEWIFTCPR